MASRKNDKQGKWVQNRYWGGADSSLWTKERDPSQPFQNAGVKFELATVLYPEVEPIYEQTTVAVQLVDGQAIIAGVYWPGPNVEINPVAIHGLYESPMPGQMVLLGYIHGDTAHPVIVQKYPYSWSKNPVLESFHLLAMTRKLIGPFDTVLGNFTGSFIALRGTLPLPAEIDIVSLSLINVLAAAAITMTAGAAMTMTSGAAVSVTSAAAMTLTSGAALTMTVAAAGTLTTGAALSLTSGAAMTISSGAGMSIAASAPIIVTAAPSIIVNGGFRPVAALGDLVPTLMGPMPIAATGISILV